MDEIPAVNLNKQHASISAELDDAIARVLVRGTFILGVRSRHLKASLSRTATLPMQLESLQEPMQRCHRQWFEKNSSLQLDFLCTRQ
jgi:hypothetical protein